MQALHLEIGYTQGEANANIWLWLGQQVPPLLRPLNLETTVFIAGDRIRTVDFALHDDHLHELTKTAITTSSVRRRAIEQNAWYIHVLYTSMYTATNVLGVMYDHFDPPVREGFAVFLDTVGVFAPSNLANFRRLLLRTTLHELGHCLTLDHRNDQTLMAQTQNVQVGNDWIRRLQLGYHPEDRRFIIEQPAVCKPGGNRLDLDGTVDKVSYKKDKLRVSFHSFYHHKKMVFRSGDPVSFLVKLKNNSSSSIALPLPLNTCSENVRIWIKSPYGNTIRRRRIVKTCGLPNNTLQLNSGDHRWMPLHLYADRNGYLFDTHGEYKIKLAVKSSNGEWFTSKFHAFTIRGVKSSQLSKQEKIHLTKFLEFGGSSNTAARKKTISLANRKEFAGSDLRRAVYWNLTYDLKRKTHGTEKDARKKQHAKALLDVQKTLLKLEKSSVRKGKVLKDYFLSAEIVNGKSVKPTKTQMTCIKAYETIESKLIKY